MLNFGELQLVHKCCQQKLLPEMLIDRDLNCMLETPAQNLNPTKKKNHIPTLAFKNINISPKHSQTNHTLNKSSKASRLRKLIFRRHAEETTKGKPHAWSFILRHSMGQQRFENRKNLKYFSIK